jgi:hypothetical protein
VINAEFVIMPAKAGTSVKSRAPGAAMEGAGFYNRHSAMQAAGISLLLSDWETAARETAISGDPIVIADYGSSQGRNSMPPMRIAIDELRARAGGEKPIQVIHTDLPSNDFAALFMTLSDDPSSYMKSNGNVFPSAVGRSYFEPILPPGSVNLGWNSWTMHWMSAGVDAEDHVFPGLSQDEGIVRQTDEIQAGDWRRFLTSRSSELKSGGRMLTAFVGKSAEGTGWNWIGDNLWGAIEDLGREGLLNRDERVGMTVPANGRTIEHIRAPFDSRDRFSGLRLVKAEMLIVPDGTWTAFQSNGDAHQLGTAHANMIRAVCNPTLAGALGARPDKAEVLDQLYARLAERLAAAPDIHEGRLAVAVLEKL